MDHKIGRLIERYLIGDIVDIILEYNKKCLWEYKIEFPSREDANGFDCFDDYLINKKPKSEVVLNLDEPALFRTSADGMSWSQPIFGQVPFSAEGQFVSYKDGGVIWVAGTAVIKEPQKTTRQTLIPGAFKWDQNFNCNDDDDEDNVKKIGKTETLFLGFSCKSDLWIPVSKDEHIKVYNYLKQYFDFL